MAATLEGIEPKFYGNKVLSLINTGNYRDLVQLLDHYTVVVDVMVELTRSGKVGLDSEQGRQSWRHVIGYFLSQANYRRAEDLKYELACIYLPEFSSTIKRNLSSLLFGIGTALGMGNPEGGELLRSRFEDRFCKRETAKLQELLGH